jgi:hypothetical protein
MQAKTGSRNFLNEKIFVYDNKQILCKGFLMLMKKKMLVFKKYQYSNLA